MAHTYLGLTSHWPTRLREEFPRRPMVELPAYSLQDSQALQPTGARDISCRVGGDEAQNGEFTPPREHLHRASNLESRAPRPLARAGILRFSPHEVGSQHEHDIQHVRLVYGPDHCIHSRPTPDSPTLAPSLRRNTASRRLQCHPTSRRTFVVLAHGRCRRRHVK